MYIYIGPIQILKVVFQPERIICERVTYLIGDEARFLDACVGDIECMSVLRFADGLGQSRDNLQPIW